MKRKILAGVSAAALGLTGLALTAGSAQAAKPPVNASGTLSCTLKTGKVKISPPLLFFGTAGAATFKTKINTVSCSGTSGITSFKGELNATLPTNDCFALAAQPFPGATITKTKLKGTGKYNPANVTFTAGSTFTAANPIVMDMPGGGTSTISGGSFAGQSLSLHLVYEQPAETFATNCTAKTKGLKGSGGLKKMSFGPGSTLTVG